MQATGLAKPSEEHGQRGSMLEVKVTYMLITEALSELYHIKWRR
jgi:hypothetical protein